MMKQEYRNLVINLLDSADGIPEHSYRQIVEFTDKHFQDICDDVWSATEGAEGNNGYCIYLNEDTAAELRKKS